MIKYSVIIPVYNAEKTIERCVLSVMNNSYKNIEVILIDDCSNDNSWQVCEWLAEKYSNIIVLHNSKNRGVSYTRNRGLACVSGKYMMFVDSDDWIEKNYIACFDEIIESYQPQMVVCGYFNHDEKNSGRTDTYGWNDFEYTKTCYRKKMLKDLYEGCLLQQLWNKVFVSAIIKEKGIRFDESINIGEDFRFVLDYLQFGRIDKFILINKLLYHYMRDQDGSLMYNVGYESIDETLWNLRKLYELMEMEVNDIELALQQDYWKQIEITAYLIFHNAGMRGNEKKRLILKLDKIKGEELFHKNRRLFYKEKIVTILKKIYKKKWDN